MAVLGTGSGTGYPGAVDTYSVEQDSVTRARAAVPNDTNAAVTAIEGELGTNPKGTAADVKTFLQTEHNTNGTHGTITTASTTVVANLNAEQHNGLKVKVINIGDWNMDVSGTLAVNHGLTLSSIRNVSVSIRNDSDDTYLMLSGARSAGSVPDGDFYAGGSAIFMRRTAGGEFDSVSYDSTSYNRGYITIWYIP